jgi:hypothetical protein
MAPMRLPERCVDLTAAQVMDGLRSRSAMRELLEHMADIARPATGAPKILVPIARMASDECDWVGGGLVVEISGTGSKTTIDVFVEIGGARTALFPGLPRLVLDVPKEEFVRAAKLAPKLVFPMKSRLVKHGVVLTCEAKKIGVSKAPPFAVAEAAIRKSLPAELRRSLPPIDPGPSIEVAIPVVGEAAILKRMLPKGLPVPKLDELADIDSGWEETRSSRIPSKAPARVPSKKPPPRKPLKP